MKIIVKNSVTNIKEDLSQKMVISAMEKIVTSKRREDIVKKKVKRLSEKNVDLSPRHFSINEVPLVPFFMINILEWLINHKPVSLIKEKPAHIPRKSSFIKSMRKDVLDFNQLQRALDCWTYESDSFKMKDPGSESSLSKLDYHPREDTSEINKFKVKIEESPTFVLFYQAKRCAIQGTTIAKRYKRENGNYLNNIRKCKKVFNVDVQTPLPFKKSKCTETYKYAFKDKKILCSKFESVDSSPLMTESKIVNNAVNTHKPSHELPTVDHLETTHIELKTVSIDHFNELENLQEDDNEFSEAIRMVEIIQSEEFCRTSLCLLRVLERIINEKNQIIVKQENSKKSEEENVKFKYSIIYLRTARHLKVWSLPVTSISVNPINKNVFAVGHGQYFNDQPDNLGRVNLWNLKNLSVPEKSVDFKSGVSSVEFSKSFPYALLLSFVKGYISILDVTKRTPMIIVTNKSEHISDHIWQAYWFKNDVGTEVPVSCGSDGIVSWYHLNNFQRNQLLVLLEKESSVRGIELPKPRKHFFKTNIHPNIYCLAPHPTNPLKYLAGTEDGCVHLCSTDCWNKHLESMQAHHGPVHIIKYHPHTPMVFLTAGIDYCIRIWAPTIYEPLITIDYFKNYVEDAEWSPQHPTILVTLSGSLLHVWDIRRIVIEPCNTFKSPTDSRFTTVKFFNENTLICGDIHGDVHILELKDLPYIPNNKATALAVSIKRVLLGNYNLLDQLRKLGPPFDENYEEKIILA